jgi:uncharacterized protein YndB with AHSA1/START domain
MRPKTKTTEFTITRTVPATPAEAYDGWLDPTCPGTTWNAAAKLVLDPKVDGLYYWLFLKDNGEEMPHYGRFTVLDRPRKIQYTWMSNNTLGLESLVTVTFEKQGVDTILTLRHQNLPDDEHGLGHEKGWNFFMGRFVDRFLQVRSSG